MSHPVFCFQTHGFVRVAACTPRVRIADAASNAEEIATMLREGHARHVDLMLFPELALSAYAIDDLLLQDAVLDAVEAGIASLCEASRKLRPVLVVGAPVRRNGRLYNAGVVIAGGAILGVVPKSFLPNYREYYEARWFAPGAGVEELEIELAGQTVPFGTDLLFAAKELPDFTFHVEICEDFWAPTPPSSWGALAGAHILCNLSASNVVVGKADDRETLCASQSMRCQAAYVYSAAGGYGLPWFGVFSFPRLVPVDKALAFESSLRQFMKTKYGAIMDKIATNLDLPPDDEKALSAAIEDFKKTGTY